MESYERFTAHGEEYILDGAHRLEDETCDSERLYLAFHLASLAFREAMRAEYGESENEISDKISDMFARRAHDSRLRAAFRVSDARYAMHENIATGNARVAGNAAAQVVTWTRRTI